MILALVTQAPGIVILKDVDKVNQYLTTLSQWGRVTHTCISKLTIIDSDNGLSPG